MTGNLNDGTAVPEGQQATPTPASSPEPQKPFDGDVSTLLKSFNETLEGRFANLEKTFAEKLGRVQGTVDRQTNDFRKWMGDVERLEKGGMSRDEAIAKLETDQQSEQRWQTFESRLNEIASLVRGGGVANAQAQMLTEVMSEYKLDPKDPYVASQLQGKKFENRTEAEAWAGRVFREKMTSNQPNAAQQASSPMGSVPKQSVEELTRQYQSDMMAVPRGYQGDAQRRELKERARKAGVPVDQIGFR